MIRPIAPLAALALLLSGCGTEVGGSTPRASQTPVARPTAVPAAEGVVSTRYPVIVLDDGDGAELCLGGVAESLPPQCGGPPLIGWDWSQYRGHFEERSGVRWGEFSVTGTFDGTSFTPTAVVPAAEVDPSENAEHDRRFATPCPEPDGGWRVLDPALTNDQTMARTFVAAEALDGYADAWVDQSINPVYGSEDDEVMERELNDPTKLIINVRVTRDPAAAETGLRRLWGGALCVSTAEHTQKELLAVQEEVNRLPGMLSSGTSYDRVELGVIYDDWSIQAWLDQEYGEGLVVVSSALVDAE